MDIKLNLPTDECTCEAKQFYDKYRRQVDDFIQHEIETAETTDVVVGKKRPKAAVSKKTSVFPEKSSQKKIHLPKIQDTKHKKTKEEESESESLSASSTSETLLPDIKVTKKWSDEIFSSSSSENLAKSTKERTTKKDPKQWRKEAAELQLKKKKKTDDFVSVLNSKAKKEGLDDDFVTDLLAKAREAGQEQDLLLALSNANDEGTLNKILFNMLEAMEKGNFEEMATILVKEGKEKRKNSLLLKLLKLFKSGFVDLNYMGSLIVQAREEDPNDELLFMLFKAAQENTLDKLLSSLHQAQKQGKFEEMVSILQKKGQKEQNKQLFSIAKSVAQEKGIDEKFIEELMLNAKKAGQLDELLATLMKAKFDGNLDEIISNLANAKNVSNSISSSEESEEREQTELRIKDAFDNELLANWFAKAKTREEKNDLKRKLSKILKRGKHIYFNALIQEKGLENLDDLINLLDEVISDDGSDTATAVIREKKPKSLSRRHGPMKRAKRRSKEYERKPKVKAEEDAAEISLVKDNYSTDKTKKKLLLRRKFSMRSTLPDIDYKLIERYRLPTVDLSEPEKSDEEEQVYAHKEEEKRSKVYRESFLKKIYARKKIETTSESSPFISSSSTSRSSSKASKHSQKPKRKHREIDEHLHPPTPRTPKRHFVKYAKKKSLHVEKEMSDSDLSTFEELLNKKITKVCDTSAEEQTERGYLVGFRYKDDDDIAWRKIKKTIVSTDSDSEEISRTRRRAVLYIKMRQIEEFFHFLGSHLISDKPDNPIDYLVALLGKCIQFRNGVGQPPLLFEQKHVESLYKSMDVFDEGFVSLDQYRIGMKTLFIHDFKEMPPTNQQNMVLKEIFINEALKRQRIHLRNMLRGTSRIFDPKRSSGSNTLGSIWSKIELYHEG